jgi:hypothetical protein
MDTARIALVLKTGGEYTVKHAQVLARQIQDQLPFHEIVCLSDVIVPGVHTILLQHGWPCWWSKMELCRPDIPGDLLYFDLDTVIISNIEALAEVNRLTLLRDFYRNGVFQARPEGLGSGVMYLPQSARAEVWEKWNTNPQQYMQEFRRGGDQAFLETLWLGTADRWQDVLPRQLVSYKMHVRGKSIPPEARCIVFHGRPRPWAVYEFQHLYRAA